MDKGIDRDPARRRPFEEPEASDVEAREHSPEVRRRRGADLITLAEGISWGPIFAGVLAALVIFLLLELLVFGLGLVTAIDRPGNAGNEDWLSGIIGLIAFFVGAYFASIIPRDGDNAPAAGRDARLALLNGLLVWALGTVLILALCALGLGQIFGALGDVVGQSRALGEPSNAVDPLKISDTVRSSALGAFFSLLVWAAASAAGGWLASKGGTRTGRAMGAERRRY